MRTTTAAPPCRPARPVGDSVEDTVRCLHWRSLPAFAFERHVRDEARARAEAGSSSLLNIGHLRCYYPVRRRILEFLTGKRQTFVHAVDGIDIELGRGWTLSIVGESGCGKTTLGRAVVGLQPASAAT